MPSTSTDRSYPSAPITFADVPEVKRFRGEFVYNFFEPDEGVNDKGVDVDRNNDNLERKIERDVGRLVKFSFRPVRLSPVGKPNFNEFRGQKDFEERPTSLERHFDKITIEQDLTNTSFTGMRFQDDSLDDKLFAIMSGTMVRRVRNFNRRVKRQFRTTSRRIRRRLKKSNVNLFDAAKLLSTGQGDREAQLIVEGLNNLKRLNARFIDEEEQREKIQKRFERVQDVGVDVQINSKFLHTAMMTIAEDPFNLYADEILPILREAAEEQERAIGNSDPGSMDASEYETFANPVKTRNVDVSSFDTRRSIAGYIIDKREIQDDGTAIERDPIIVQDADATKAFDTDIAYGRRYVYEIRAVAEVEFVATIEDEDDIVAATILISSKASRQQVIDTEEFVPPPPPADFNVDWDRTNRASRLTWCFPVNPQRDIKKFQIFRRLTINDPFELIKEYDFDDSILRIESGETVSERLTEELTSPRNFFIDHSFNRTSKFIYAVVAIDAHGFTSNYSAQFEARYDQARNDIDKTLVSVSGAPKSYPNMFVNQEDVLVDVIRDSGHSQVDVHFDPEFLEVVNRRGRRLNLLATDAMNALYRLQLINTDLQRGAVLDIVLKDRRKPVPPQGKRRRARRRGRKPRRTRTSGG